MTLTEFLLARFADDEARAPRKRAGYYDQPCPRCGRPVSGLGSPLDDEAVRALHPDDFGLGCPLDMDQWNDLMPDLGPSPECVRVLAEVEAKRRIVERCAAVELPRDAPDVARTAWDAFNVLNRATLRDLAAPYADHADFDPRWAR